MVLESLLGQQGSILTTINRFVPGAAVYLAVIAVVIFFLSILRGKDLSEKKAEPISYLAVLLAIVFVLTASVPAVIIMIIVYMIVQSEEFFEKLKLEYGSADERKNAESAGISASEHRALIRRLKRLEKEKGNEPLSKAAAEEENALAEEAERQAELELHEAAIAGCLNKITETTVNLQNREMSVEKRSEQVAAAIEAIDQQLTQMSNRGAMDEAGLKYLTQTAGQLAANIGELVKDKKYEEEYRKKAAEVFKKAVKTIKRAAHGAGKIEQRAKKAEEKIGKLEITQIALVEAEIKKEENRLKKLMSHYFNEGLDPAVQKSIERQMAGVEQRIAFLEKEKKKLEEMAAILEKAQADVMNTIKKMFADVLDMIKEANDAVKKETALEKFETEFKKIVEAMARAQEKFSEEISKVEKDEIPEEIAIKTTANVGTVYTKLLEITKKVSGFNTEQLKPFIQTDVIGLLKKAEEVTKSLYYVEFFQIRLTEAFEELNKMAAEVAGGKRAEKLKAEVKKEKAQEDLERYIASKGKVVLANLEATMKNADSAIIAIDEHEKYLNKEYDETQLEEKATIQALAGFMNTLMNNKKRVHKKFMKDADEFTARFKQAQDASAAARTFAAAA